MSIDRLKDWSAPDGWTLPTFGDALSLVSSDIADVAGQLGVEPCALHAVILVESSGSGFDSKNRPKLRYENHWFQKFTNGRHDDSDPDLSCPYGTRQYNAMHGGGSDQQWDLLTRAFELDQVAAVKACSWGMFQVMGFNADKAGWGTDPSNLKSFVDAMFHSEAQHLRAFSSLVQSSALAGYLSAHDWASFALHYNGGSYRDNDYDTRMAQHYADCIGSGG